MRAPLAWSIAIGGLGMLVTWLVATLLAWREAPPNPVVAWILGLPALGPAWLIAFVRLLGPSQIARPEPSLEVAFILSSSAALLGVILTDAVVRRLRASGREHGPAMYGLLGVGALFPAWAIALAGLAWIQP